jgi:dihydrofolate reductase
MITIIAAMTERGRIIGKNGRLPWNIPEELNTFRSATRGATVIMGRKTFEETGLLPGRKTIVVTRSMNDIEGADVCRTLEMAVGKAKGYGKEIFVIGGGEIFSETLRKELVDRMVLSYIKDEYQGDTRFPEFDESKWKKSPREDHERFYRITYMKRK